jgi:hypothetical protein
MTLLVLGRGPGKLQSSEPPEVRVASILQMPYAKRRGEVSGSSCGLQSSRVGRMWDCVHESAHQEGDRE